MTTFDMQAALNAREADPALTVFDTGEMLQPVLHYADSGTDGSVDFDDAENYTVLTLFAHPSGIEDDTIILNIDSALLSKLKIVVNDAHIATVQDDGSVTYSPTKRERIYELLTTIETKTISELAQAVILSQNETRDHLVSLKAEGLVQHVIAGPNPGWRRA